MYQVSNYDSHLTTHHLAKICPTVLATASAVVSKIPTFHSQFLLLKCSTLLVGKEIQNSPPLKTVLLNLTTVPFQKPHPSSSTNTLLTSCIVVVALAL